MASNFAEALFQGRNDAISSRLGQQQAQREQQRFDMGMQKEERALETDKRKALYDLASGYKSFIAKNPQGGQQYYETFLKPSLAGLGLGDAGPYDPTAVASVADQVIAAYGGKAARNPYSELPADIQSLSLLQDNPQLAALDRERRQASGMVPKLVETAQGYGWGTPGAGIALAPLDGVAGQSPAPMAPALQLFSALSQKYGLQPTSVKRTPDKNREVGGVANSYHLTGQAADWVVPAPMKAQFMQDARANGYEAIDEGDHVHIEPARGGSSAPIAQPFQKPATPSALADRVQMARDMGATDDQIRDMVINDKSAKPSAAEQKDALARKAKQPQVANVARGLDRIATALQSLSGGMVNTGPVDQYATRYTKAGQELEAAVGGIQNSLLSLTRVPGIGSQSDLEARIAAMQYPSLDKYPEVNARTLQNLQAFVADLEEAYRMADAQDSAALPEADDDIDSLLDMYR